MTATEGDVYRTIGFGSGDRMDSTTKASCESPLSYKVDGSRR